jgi:hypothetical protein
MVFLRTRVLVGQLSLQAEQDLIAQTKQWLQQNAQSQPAYERYLARWGDWPNPWESPSPVEGAEEPGGTTA